MGDGSSGLGTKVGAVIFWLVIGTGVIVVLRQSAGVESALSGLLILGLFIGIFMAGVYALDAFGRWLGPDGRRFARLVWLALILGSIAASRH